MKRLLILSTLFLGCLFLLTNCEGDQGPAGPAGTDGVDGIDGVDGQDAATSCIECHTSSTDLYVKQVQFDNSIHKVGGNFERNWTSCAGCHTHEGFMERLVTGELNTAAPIDNPSPVNCRTCHKIHESYTQDDYDLRVVDPVTLVTGDVVDLGMANMCVGCHQSRPYTLPDVGGADYEITSKRYGPHHGPQSNLIFGLGGYEVPGSLPYVNTPHSAVPDGCVSCHMATAYGNQGGGHSFNMTYDYHGGDVDNIVACTSCHSTLESFDYNGVQTEIEGLLEELKQLLLNEGVYNPADGLLFPGTYSADVAGAAFNFKYIEEDRSHGIHNPAYTRALLTNSIEALK